MKIRPLLCAAALSLVHHAQAFLPFDGSELLNQVNNYTQMESATEMISGSIETDDYTRVVKVPEKGKNDMMVSYSANNKETIKEGDPVLVRLVADGEAHNGDAAIIHAKLQVNEKPWPTLTGRNQALTKEPETYELVFTADKDYYPGDMGFVIFAAHQAQTIRLRSLKIYAGEEAVASVGSKVLYDIDFEDGYKEVGPLGDTKASVSGSIPQEFTEDTSWADVDVIYTPVTEAVFAGEKSLRVEVIDVKSGYAQLRLDQFPASSENYLDLSFAIKSTSMAPFTVAIRENKIPFTKYWQTTAQGAPEWKTVQELIPPIPDDLDAELVIELSRPGLYEFDNLKIVATPKDIIEQGEQVAGNLLLNSSFPFGFQRPWRGNTGVNNGLVHLTDESVIGPTGQPAMKILGTERHEFIKFPFKGKPGSKHTLSFWAKSGQHGTGVAARIGPPSEQLWIGDWGSNHILTTEWQRISHTVMLPFHADGFYEVQIYVRTADTMWVDGLMVEVADEMNDFQRAAPVELTVIPTHGVENNHNLFFQGEPISVNVGMMGDRPEGSKLVVRTEPFHYDVDEVVNELPIAGEGNRELKIDIPFDILGLAEFGTAYIRFQVVDAEGEPLSKLSETTVHVVREPRGWGKFIHNSPFGTHVAANEGMITTGKRLGFNWVRSFQMGWMSIQKEEGGPFDWTKLDQLVGWWRKNHLEVLGIYGHTPNWANMTGGQRVPGAGFKERMFAVRDSHLDDWANYAAKLSERYEDVIRVYETWNEPFLAGFLLKDYKDGRSIHADPEMYFKMTKAVHDRLEADGIDVDLAWNFGPHYPDGTSFDQTLADMGMFDLHDVVTYHSYERNLGGYLGDPYEQMIEIMQDFKAKNGKPGKTLWNSESGPGGGHQHNIYPTIPITNMSGMQLHYAKYMSRAWNSMLANGVERNYIYFLNDGGYWRPNYDLMQPDGSVSPHLVAFSNLAWHIEGKTFVEIVPLSESFHAYVYEGPEGVAVSMVPRELGTLQLPGVGKGWRFSDLFGNELVGDSISMDFWIHVEGDEAKKVIKWLKKHWGE